MKWWFSYLEKLVRNCSIVVMLLVEKKKFWIDFEFTSAAKETKASTITVLVDFWWKKYLFFYLFVFILYLWLNLCVYIYVFIWFIVCVLRILVQGGGRFWAKGNKATSGEALPVVHCTERTFSTFVLCTNISKWPHKKPKSQENWKKCLEGWGTLFPYY